MEVPPKREITFPLRMKISLSRCHDKSHKEWTEIVREWEGCSRKTEKHMQKGNNWVWLMLPVSGLWEGEKLKLKLRCRILPGDQMVKNLPVMQETWVQSMGQEDPLEKGMVTHSSILAWRIPWTKPVPQSMGSKELDMTERLTHRPPMPCKGAWTLKILYMKKKLWTLLNKKHGIWFVMVQHGTTTKNRLERCESERNFQLAFIHRFLSSGL